MRLEAKVFNYMYLHVMPQGTAKTGVHLNRLVRATCVSSHLTDLFGFSPDVKTLNAPIAAKVVCWNVKEASMANSVGPDQTAPILNSSVMLGNYLQQTT